MSKNVVTVLDVGSSKVVAVTGERGVNGTFAVKNMAEVNYDGFSEGEFFNVEGFKTAVKSALTSVGESSECPIRKVFVGVPSAFIKLDNRKFRLSLGKKRKIRRRDIDGLLNAGKDKVATNGYEVIYSSDIYFTLDDNRRVLDPIGNVSSVIGGFITYQLCETYFTSILRDTLGEVGVVESVFVYDGYCEGKVLSSHASSEAPLLIVDVGYISTGLTLFSGNGVLLKSAFDYGGGFIAAAFVEKYGLSPEAAEKLKRSVSLGYIRGGQSHYTVDDGGEIFNFAVEDVNETVKGVLDLLAENLDGFIEDAEKNGYSLGEIYLCGGGVSFMRGATEHLSGRLGQQVELARVKVPQYGKPSQVSMIGLLDFALNQPKKIKKFFLF